MKNELLACAIQTRTMQLYYHYCHNLVTGPEFFQDHEFFATAYAEMELNYDLLVEYYISLESTLPVKTINEMVHENLEQLAVDKMSADQMYGEALKLELDLQSYLEQLDKKGSLGIKDKVGAIASSSDTRMYKMQQRLKTK